MKPTRTWIILVLGLALVLLIAPMVFAQPPVPHDEEEDGVSYEDCVSCHRTGREEAPLLAADNEYVFGEILGLSHEEIERLTQEQVIY